MAVSSTSNRDSTPSVWEPVRVACLLRRAALRAGGDGDRGTTAWQLKTDGSLVTEVDCAIEGMLTAELEDVAAGVHVLGEEGLAEQPEAYVQAALRGTAWVLDPIDGTAPFAHGHAYWGTSIGLLRGGRLVEGGVSLPTQNAYLLTDGAAILEATWGSGDSSPVLRSYRPRPLSFSPGAMVALGQRFVKRCRVPWPNPVLASGCAVNVFVHLLQGRLAAYVGHMKLWDLGGGLPLLRAAGLEARLVDGTDLTRAVDERGFVLAAGAADRWALRGTCVFGTAAACAALLPRVRELVARAEAEEDAG